MVWVKGIPERWRAVTERRKAALDGGAGAAESWRAVEARVLAELAECRKERAADAELRRLDAEQRARQGDEIFKLRIVVLMAFDEIDRHDPGSDIPMKARAIMAVIPAGGDPPDTQNARHAALLAQIDKPAPKRRRRMPPQKT